MTGKTCVDLWLIFFTLRCYFPITLIMGSIIPAYAYCNTLSLTIRIYYNIIFSPEQSGSREVTATENFG